MWLEKSEGPGEEGRAGRGWGRSCRVSRAFTPGAGSPGGLWAEGGPDFILSTTHPGGLPHLSGQSPYSRPSSRP